MQTSFSNVVDSAGELLSFTRVTLLITELSQTHSGSATGVYAEQRSANNGTRSQQLKMKKMLGGDANTASVGKGHYLYLQSQFGEDQCTQFQVIMVTDPQTHTQTHRQGRLQYTTPQLVRSVIKMLSVKQSISLQCFDTWQQEGKLACKKLGVGSLMVTISQAHYLTPSRLSLIKNQQLCGGKVLKGQHSHPRGQDHGKKNYNVLSNQAHYV